MRRLFRSFSLVCLVGFVALLLSGLVAGLECSFDSEPYIQSEVPFLENLIYWNCHSGNMTGFTCTSYVKGGGDLLQVNPVLKDVEEFGRVDVFLSNNKVVKPYFRPVANVVSGGTSYEFGVKCGNGSIIEVFNASVTPVYREFDAPVDRVLQFKDNAGFVFGGLILVVFLLAGLGLLWRSLR